MRYVTLSIVLAGLIHAGAEARANPHAPQTIQTVQAPSASVVGIMADAGQALLWDGNRGEYVVVRVGDSFHHYLVSSIAPEHVVLTAKQGNQHFVLPRTSDTSDITDVEGKHGHSRQTGPRTSWQPSGTATELLDPYPAPVTAIIGGISVLDPYGTQGPINSVTAPSGLRVSASAPIASVQAPAQSPLQPAVPPIVQPAVQPAPQPSQPASRPAPDSAPVAAAQPDTAAPAKTAPVSSAPAKVIRERYSVSRREFDAAVMDFHALSKEIQIELAEQGVRIRDLARGSLFHRLGLRAGDVVLSVDEQAIRGVDDAAAVYARLMDAKKFVAQVQRGADTVILSYRFKK
jgi:hypothetical protein